MADTVRCPDPVAKDAPRAPQDDQDHITSLLFSVTALVQDGVEKLPSKEPLSPQKSFEAALAPDLVAHLAAPPEGKYKCVLCEDERAGKTNDDDDSRPVRIEGPEEHHDIKKENIIFKKVVEAEGAPARGGHEVNDEGAMDPAPTPDYEPRRFFPSLKARVDELKERFDAVLERNKQLEASVADLARKEGDLEAILDRQTQQISSVDERQVEQERVLLAPMRNIYIRQFHDQVREGISAKMSNSSVYARQLWALQQRVNQHERAIREALAPAAEGGDLWRLIREAHAVAPKFLSKGSLWNKFVDAIVEDDEHLAALGLSQDAVQLTRYGRHPADPEAAGDGAPSRQDMHLHNKLVFAEVVAGQNDQKRPLYAELYEFYYKVPPETMYIKGEPDLPGQPVQAPNLKDEAVVV